jgi:pheromone shutdown protein TraB
MQGALTLLCIMSDIRTLGVNGFLFFALASFLQGKIGKVVGVSPGSDMRVAIVAATRVNARVALIDRSIEVTMQRLSASIGWRERFRFVIDILIGPFSREIREIGKIDLRKVPDARVVEAVMAYLARRYPSVYQVLVEERNRYMAAVLVNIANNYPDRKILAVVGAGHEKGLANLLTEQMQA